MKAIHLSMFVSLVLAVALASGQTRQEQAARVIKKAGGPSAACALLSNEEVVKITGRRSYTEPEGTQLTNGGSACGASTCPRCRTPAR